MKFNLQFTPDQLGSFARLLHWQFNRVFQKLTFENYVEYYNIKSILKKLFDKIYQLDRKKVKAVKISICPNEALAIKLVFNLDEYNSLPPYEMVLILEILEAIGKQETNYLQTFPIIHFETKKTNFGKEDLQIERDLYQ